MVRHLLLFFILLITEGISKEKIVRARRAFTTKRALNYDKGGNKKSYKMYYIRSCKNNNVKYRIIERKKKNGKIHIRIYGKDHRNPYLAHEYANKIIENKKYEVGKLLEENFEENNPLQIRMKYLQHTMNNKLSECLKRKSTDEKHRLSVVADIKRKIFCSVTRKNSGLTNELGVGEITGEGNEKGKDNFDKNINYVYQNNFLNLANPGQVSLMLHQIGFDVLIVNIDNLSTEGMLNDLSEVIKSTRILSRNTRPAIVVDDVIIHPIQIALAVENKADGVILNLSYLKNDLEDMLNYCVNLGTQAIVEVHDYNDIYYATQCGSYILMINEFDFFNNHYEYNHAIKAISYAIPELITIAKINVNDISYVEKLGSLGYDSICLEKKLIDNDLEDFVHACKSWNAPHKTLLYLNRNNYLKEFLTYKNDVPGEENHKDITDNLKKMYDDKNIPNNYSNKLLKNYEKDFIDVEEDGENGEGNNQKKGDDKKEIEKQAKDSILTSDEKQIVKNFKKEKKKELILLNQMKEIVKEVDEQCKNYDSLSDDENKKKEKKLETLLENFTKLDRNFLRGFFSDEEISNIENTIKNAIQQKNKIKNGEENFDNKDFTNNMNSIQNNGVDDLDIHKTTKEFFDKKNLENNNLFDNNSSDDFSDDTSSRGVNSQ
ncbi:protein AMR1 [Plasmodium brasilianum]|uniref:indole-3-glycerol-phosphate synthase n=2 Tax=Plasmodium (Plasmodium) TaxID=418103 RepID=A0A1A8W6D6_PLAMA|nr:conserved Plasmodium protein, unknown function [Plasmodium malariae]KAI4837090.1 protein AMR1 [Plasmodium brasilianum]SBS86713.1 conserved Plasmodium protein, unknown function [Plasmodium malariae]SCO92973.1 conserved Plasmodium protein, unknown function [Plasmodium malariae]